MNTPLSLIAGSLLAFFAVCPKVSDCQIRYIGEAPMIPVRGFIITRSGEYIHGKIAYGKFTENYMSEIKFTDKDGIKTIYSASELAGMAISVTGDYDEHMVILGNNWDIYECRPSPKKGIMVFMSRFTDGRIKVFMNRSSAILSSGKEDINLGFNGISFTYSTLDGLTIESEYVVSSEYIETRRWYSSYYVEKDGGKLIKVEKGNYEEMWSVLTGDCPKIPEEVSKNPDLEKFRNFLLVAEIYNQICN